MIALGWRISAQTDDIEEVDVPVQAVPADQLYRMAQELDRLLIRKEIVDEEFQ